MVVLELRTI